MEISLVSQRPMSWSVPLRNTGDEYHRATLAAQIPAFATELGAFCRRSLRPVVKECPHRVCINCDQ
jgi:hypothetical protein